MCLPLPAGSAHTIDGKAIADTVRKEVADKVAQMKAKTGKVRALPAASLRRKPRRRATNCGRVTFGASACVLQVPGLAVVLVGSRKVCARTRLSRQPGGASSPGGFTGLGDVRAQQEESLRRVRHGQLRHRPA